VAAVAAHQQAGEPGSQTAALPAARVDSPAIAASAGAPVP